MSNFFALPSFEKIFCKHLLAFGGADSSDTSLAFSWHLRCPLLGTGTLWFVKVCTYFCAESNY